MTIHPFIKPGQAPEQSAPADQWQGFTEQFWKDEDERARPSRVWLGVAVLVSLGLWFVIGCLVAWAW